VVEMVVLEWWRWRWWWWRWYRWWRWWCNGGGGVMEVVV
jgi:hypothetical protein